jgi:hypothetical protein
MVQEGNQLANMDQDWSVLLNLFSDHNGTNDSVTTISIHEDTTNNLLRTGWIQNIAPTPKPCSIEDIPELKKVSVTNSLNEGCVL